MLLEQKIDHEFTGDTYEMEFLAGQTKYEYEVFVSNGKIKKFKRKRADYEDLQAAQMMQGGNQAGATQGANRRITKAQAEQIAFKDLGITRKQAKFLKTKGRNKNENLFGNRRSRIYRFKLHSLHV